jgi:H+/Cl- antiporter ClcA
VSATSVAESAPPPEPTAEQAAQTMRSKRYVVLLIIVAIIGIIVSLAAWCFLVGVSQLQKELYTHLPHALGYNNGPPLWWPLPLLAIAGTLVALAIMRLPGEGGHLPAKGLAAGSPTQPIDLPGVILAGGAAVGFGLVVGPEAPLIALGSGVALLAMGALRRNTPPTARQLIAAAGSFAALSFIFDSPLIAAVILIEASGIGGPRLPLILIPGLLAAGVGSLVSIGMGSFTGLSSKAYALSPVVLPQYGHPTIGQFGWTILLAITVAVVTRGIMMGGLRANGVVVRRLLLFLPAVGLVVAGLAIAFHGITNRSINEVLFSGQDALSGLVSQAGTWTVAALIWVIVFKGIAYSLCIGSFRGGPTFPAVFLGAAGGILASHLPGFPVTPAVAVGLGTAVTAVLRLPLSAIVLATLLTSHSGTGDEPLIIVGVVVTYLVTLLLTTRAPATPTPAERTA